MDINFNAIVAMVGTVRNNFNDDEIKALVTLLENQVPIK